MCIASSNDKYGATKTSNDCLSWNANHVLRTMQRNEMVSKPEVIQNRIALLLQTIVCSAIMISVKSGGEK